MVEDPGLFEYTSGRWLYNEQLRRKEREKRFNIVQLKRLAAASVGRKAEDVCQFTKLAEGGFNRSFLTTFEDGFQLVARIPYPATVPKHLVVASEAATLSFLRARGIPVPEVYGYSATSDNAAETDFIFMEYIHGINLADVWHSISDEDLTTLIASMVELEAKLFALEFPANGSLYYTKDLEGISDQIAVLESSSRDVPLYCIGPDTTLGLWYGKRSSLHADRNPYGNTLSVLQAGARKEIAYLKTFGRPVQPLQRLRREVYGYQPQSPSEHMESLAKYLEVAPFLLPQDEMLSRPTIRHPDLQPNNVFVTANFEIKALIDWQHCSILPLFLQNGIPPRVQNYGDDVSESLQVPKMPDDINSLDEKEQSKQLDIYRRRRLHYLYVTETEQRNRTHYNAMAESFSMFRRKLYHHASDPWEGDDSVLKADLVRLTQVWPSLTGSDQAAVPSCPISFTQEEANECLRVDAEQQEADEQLESLRDIIGVGEEGWVSNEAYEEVRQRNNRMKAEIIHAAESEEDKKLILENWPFDDFDEANYS